MHSRQLSTKVSPRSKRNIQDLAQSLRDSLGINCLQLPIVVIYEALQHIDDLDLEVVEDWHLPSEEAVTYPDLKTIQVRESVYDSAYAGDPRSRFTLAHELGHYLMHRDQNASFSRSGSHKIYCDCEWQADRFASELLIDRRLFKADWTVQEVMEKFKASQKAAEIALHDKKKEEGNG
jgi:hypothetical protein